jgi:hypothetical protein
VTVAPEGRDHGANPEGQLLGLAESSFDAVLPSAAALKGAEPR